MGQILLYVLEYVLYAHYSSISTFFRVVLVVCVAKCSLFLICSGVDVAKCFLLFIIGCPAYNPFGMAGDCF